MIGKLSLALTAAALAFAPALAAGKNWTPPGGTIYAQTLSDATMRARPDLLSVTFHGLAPGTTDAYTMFAGSYPDRIGNGDDPDDIDVTRKGITILDPRWRRTNDTVPKFVVLMPLRDKTNANIGLIVYAFKTAAHRGWGEMQYFAAAAALRDALRPKIASYEALFAPAR